jgi:HEAT repeat protein
MKRISVTVVCLALAAARCGGQDQPLTPLAKQLDLLLKPNRPSLEEVEAFDQIAERLGPMMARLRVALQDQNPAIREQAAHACQNIGPSASAAVPELRTALKDQSERVRLEVADALNAMRPLAHDAIADLLKAAEADKSFMVRQKCLYALNAHRAKAALPLYLKLLQSENSDDKALRPAVMMGVSGLGAVEARSAIPILRQMVRDNDERNREWPRLALSLLADFGRKEELPLFIDILKDDKHPDLWNYAAWAVANKFGPDAKEAVPLLIQAWKAGKPDDEHERRSLRINILRAFESMGPAAKSAIPVIEEGLEDGRIRGYAKLALKSVGSR